MMSDSCLIISRIPKTRANWIVIFNVDKIISGLFTEKTFSFRIHSPVKSGLKVGLKCIVKATKTQTGYLVDQYQWMKN